MQRNPLNVVSSWRELHIPLFDLATRPIIRTRYIEPLGIEPPGAGAPEVAQIAWHVGLLTHVIAQALDRHPEWIFVTHEDLCEDPVDHDPSGVPIRWDWNGPTTSIASSTTTTATARVSLRCGSQPKSRPNGVSASPMLRSQQIEAVLERFPTTGWVRPPVTAS